MAYENTKSHKRPGFHTLENTFLENIYPPPPPLLRPLPPDFPIIKIIFIFDIVTLQNEYQTKI